MMSIVERKTSYYLDVKVFTPTGPFFFSREREVFKVWHRSPHSIKNCGGLKKETGRKRLTLKKPLQPSQVRTP